MGVEPGPKELSVAAGYSLWRGFRSSLDVPVFPTFKLGRSRAVPGLPASPSAKVGLQSGRLNSREAISSVGTHVRVANQGSGAMTGLAALSTRLAALPLMRGPKCRQWTSTLDLATFCTRGNCSCLGL